MKRIILIAICLISIFSCKKECTVAKNILTNKIKTLTQYENTTDSANELTRFYFYFDSINKYVDSIQIEIKYSGNYFYKSKLYSIYSRSTNYLIVHFNGVFIDDEYYKIYLQDHQITAITQIDINTNLETDITTIFHTNNNIDSVHTNTGVYQNTYKNINIDNKGNCFQITEILINTIEPALNASRNYNFSYSNYLNDNTIGQVALSPLGSQFYGLNFTIKGSGINFILYALNIEGYYIVNLNKNLIDSTIRNNLTGETIITKYHYEFTNNNVSKVKFTDYRTDAPGTFYYRYNDMTYY
jgi:hypothetical protein